MKLKDLPLKLKLFLPVSIIISVIIIILTLWIYSDTVKSFKESPKQMVFEMGCWSICGALVIETIEV